MKLLFLALVAVSGLWADACPTAPTYGPNNPPNQTLAQLGITNCIYVAAAGNDANPGTKASPWQFATGMTSSTHNTAQPAGTGFIVKGGDTWHMGNSGATPYTGGTWAAGFYATSATSANPIYYGVDQTWFDGGSWSRPVMTADNPACGAPNADGVNCFHVTAQSNNLNTGNFQAGPPPTGATATLDEWYVNACQFKASNSSYNNVMFDFGSVPHLILDGIEFTGLCSDTTLGGVPATDGQDIVINYPSTGSDWHFWNVYVHGVTHTRMFTIQSYSCDSSSCPGSGDGGGGTATFNIRLFKGGGSQFYPDDQFRFVVVDGFDSDPRSFFTCYCGFYDVAYSYFGNHGDIITRDVNNIWHDNTFEKYSENGHSNVLESVGAGTGTVVMYNNVIRHVNVNNDEGDPGVTQEFGPGGVGYYFNNVFYDWGQWQYFGPLGIPSGNGTVNIFSNTWQSNSGLFPTNSVQISCSGCAQLNIESSLFISDIPVTTTCCQNLTYTNSQATGLNYVMTGSYALTPPSGAAAIGGGKNETTTFCAQIHTIALTNPNYSDADAACPRDTTYGANYNFATHSIVQGTPARASVARPAGAWTVGAFEGSGGGGGPTSPAVTTTTVPLSSITTTSASSGGTVNNNGGASVTSEGVCYGLSANPTSPCTNDGTATPFTSSLTGLTQGTQYHYRAFAANSAGTGFGLDQTFQTLGPPPPQLLHTTNCGFQSFPNPGGAACTIPATTAGTTLIIGFITAPGALPTLTAMTAAGGTCQEAGAARALNTGDQSMADLWYCRGVTAGTTSLNIVPNATANAAAVIWEFTIINANDPTQTAVLNSQPATASPTGATAMTVPAQGVVISLADVSTTISGIHAGNPFTNDSLLGSNGWAHLVTGAAGSYTPQWDCGSNCTFNATTAVFLSASGSPAITTMTLPTGTVNAAYSQTVNANGNAPITWTIVAGALPPGLSGCNNVTGPSCVISGTPTTANPYSFTLQAGNGILPNAQQALSITIQPPPVPGATLSCTPHDFGNQMIGSTSAGFPCTLTSTGTAQLTISAITPSGDFADTSNCPLSPAHLAIGDSCLITTTFTPTLTGVRNGPIAITDDAPTSPQPIVVMGTGIPAITGSISTGSFSGGTIAGTTWPFPASHDFGSVAIGTPATYTAVVRGPVTIQSIVAPGDTTGNVLTPASGNLNTIVQAAAAGTLFTIGTGTYHNQSITPKAGDVFVGQSGALMSGSITLSSFTGTGPYVDASGYTPVGGQPFGMCDSNHPGCGFLEDLYFTSAGVTIIKHRVLPGAGCSASVTAAGTGSWCFDTSTGNVYSFDNPSGFTVEMSTTQTAFGGSATGVVISGLTIEKYADFAQNGAVGFGGGTNWAVTDTELRYNHGDGIELRSNWSAIGNFSHHNGGEGIGGDGSTMLVQGNEIASNNQAGFDCNWGCGGIKVAQANGYTAIGNYVHDNLGTGLWDDIDSINVLIDSNYVSGSSTAFTGTTGGVGILHEISYGATISNNTIVANGGAGILLSTSQNTTVTGNKIVNDGATLGLQQDSRGVGAFGAYVLAGNTVTNNQFSNSVSPNSLSYELWSTGSAPTGNVMNNNAYHDSASSSFTFNSVPASFAAWQSDTGFDASSTLDPAALAVPAPPSGSLLTREFTQTNNCPLAPTALAAGATCTITVTYTPAATGKHTGALTITNSAGPNLNTITLTGTGF